MNLFAMSSRVCLETASHPVVRLLDKFALLTKFDTRVWRNKQFIVLMFVWHPLQRSFGLASIFLDTRGPNP